MSTPSTVAVQAQLETNFNHSHTSTAAALVDETGKGQLISECLFDF